MIGLIRAELLRVFSRRLFRVLGALALLGLLVALVITAITSREVSNSNDLARRDYDRCVRDTEQFRNNPPPGEQPPPLEDMCGNLQDLERHYDKRFRYAESMPETTRGIAGAWFVLAFVVGASFVGADWGSGGMTTLLTWEPRRGRVLAAKTIAIVGVCGVAVILFLALMNVLFIPVAHLRGVADNMTGAMWKTLAGTWLRGAAISMFASALAAGLATLMRNTAGAIGIGAVYGIILDPLASFLWEGRFLPWMLTYNVARMLGVEVPVRQGSVPAEDGFGQTPSFAFSVLSINRPLILFTLYALGVLGIAYAAFRSRDVAG